MEAPRLLRLGLDCEDLGNALELDSGLDLGLCGGFRFALE